jgi:branched-chain amino acid transport system substrate-binding protein
MRTVHLTWKGIALLLAALVVTSCQPASSPPAAAPKEAAKSAAPTAAPAKEGAAPKEAAAPKEQAAAKPAAKADAGGPIKIGMIAPRTGTLAAYGEAGTQAVDLFIQDLNAQGGWLGRKVELIARDSKGAQDEAVRHARDLLLSERVDFLLQSTNSAECLGISDVAREAKKIFMSSCGIDDFTTVKGHRYAFRVANINTRTQGESAAQYAKDNLKNIKTVATIAHDYAFGRSVVEFFKAKMKALHPDVQFVGESWPKLTETDYSPYVTALQNQKADVTFYSFGTAIPFFNQAAPVNLHKQTILLSSYWGGVDEIATLKEETFPEGAILGGYPWYFIDNAANKQFVEKYRAKTNQFPRGSSYFDFMSMQFLNEAIKKAGTIDTEKVVDALDGLQVETLVGAARMRPFDHQGATPHWVGKAKWDPQMKMGVLSDYVKLESEQFLPTEAEIKKARGQ